MIITLEEVKKVIQKFLNRKAPGPDSIPNEILKIIASTIKEDLAQAVSELLQTGNIPNSYKESITAVI